MSTNNNSNNNNNNWVIGVVLGLLGSIAINTGNNIQSLGLKRLKEERKGETEHENKPRKAVPQLLKRHSAVVPETVVGIDDNEIQPHKSKIWIIGTVLFLSGSILNFYSFAFAAQSLLASLESIQFVTNLLFGKCMLGATVTRGMMVGTLLTVLGTISAVQFSSKDAIELDTNDMKELYGNPGYITYLVFSVVLLIGLGFVYRLYDSREKTNRPLRYTAVVIPWSYSIWGALVGTQSVVHAKIIAELFSAQSRGKENIFSSWFTYMTIILWMATAGVWLKQLSDALLRFDPIFIIPLLQCSFIFFAIISGGIYFKEFDAFSVQQWAGFWGSICVVFIGLVFVTRTDSNKDQMLVQQVTDLILYSTAVTEQGEPNTMQGMP